MKALRFFGLCLLLCAPYTYAQDSSTHEDNLITIEKVRRSWEYYYQGDQLKLADLVSVLKTNEKTSLMIDPVYRRTKTALVPAYVGGGLLVAGSIIMLANTISTAGDPYSSGGMQGVGLSLLGATISLATLPFLRRYDRQIHSIVEIYNDDLIRSTSYSQSVRLGFTNHGFGVIIDF